MQKKGLQEARPYRASQAFLAASRYTRSGGLFFDGCLVNNHFLNIAGVGQVKHGANERLLQDGSQTARTRLACQRLARNCLQGRWANLQLHTFHGEELAVLFDERVLGLCQDLHQRVFAQLSQRRHHRHTAYQLRDDAELDQVFRFDLLEDIRQRPLLLCCALLHQNRCQKLRYGFR